MICVKAEYRVMGIGEDVDFRTKSRSQRAAAGLVAATNARAQVLTKEWGQESFGEVRLCRLECRLNLARQEMSSHLRSADKAVLSRFRSWIGQRRSPYTPDVQP